MPLLITKALPRLAAFAGGAVLFLYDEKFIICRWAVPVAVAVIMVAVLTGTATVLAPLLFTYLLFVLRAIIPLWQVGSRFDVSYGGYIYGWPVQQVVA